VISLPDILQLKVRNHIILNSYKHYFTVTEIDFLKNVPFIIREAVSKYLHTTLIGKIDFFKDKHSNFLHELVPKLKKSHFFKNEIIYYIGEQPEEIYFIDKGQVGLKLEQLVFRIYHQGSYFGEIEIIEDTLRSNTAFASSQELEAFILMKKELFSMKDNFPEVFHQLAQCAKTKKMKNEEALSKSSYSLFRDVMIESSSELSALSNSKENQRLVRRDTEVIISVKNDNQHKKRNRALWSEAVEGNSKGSIYRRAKTLKRSLSLINYQPVEIIPSESPRIEKYKKVKFCKFNGKGLGNRKIASFWMHDRLFLNALLEPFENKIVENAFEQFKKTDVVEISVDRMKSKVYSIADIQKNIQSGLSRLSIWVQNNTK
jgi:CRP-like cAMP-binding protein